MRSVLGWSVISWTVCAYSEAGEIGKKGWCWICASQYHHNVPIPSCSARFVPFLASLCTDPSSPQEKSGGGGLYTGYAFASCQRKRKIKYRMIFRHRTLDPAGMNVHVDLNFFWTFQSQRAHVTLPLCFEFYLNVTLRVHFSVTFKQIFALRCIVY